MTAIEVSRRFVFLALVAVFVLANVQRPVRMFFGMECAPTNTRTMEDYDVPAKDLAAGFCSPYKAAPWIWNMPVEWDSRTLDDVSGWRCLGCIVGTIVMVIVVLFYICLPIEFLANLLSVCPWTPVRQQEESKKE